MAIRKETPATQSFGSLLASRRKSLKIGLRELANRLAFDPGNMSKVERGQINPPANLDVLSKWALELGIKSGSAEYYNFIDRAFIGQRLIPTDLLKSEILRILPRIFRDIRTDKITMKAWRSLARGVSKPY